MKMVIVLMIGMAVFSPILVMGHGTPAGTVITNAIDRDGNNAADQSGEVVGMYTNAGGYTNYAKATNITVSTVAAAYDLSIINNPANATNSPGSYVDYTYNITNWGNVSAQMVIRVSSNAGSSTWGNAQYELWTNYGAGFGLAVGPTNFITNQLLAVAPDTGFQLRVRVHIPAIAQDGSSNVFFFEIWDPAWNGTSGDSWPGPNAISPATPDTNDVRDYQTDYVTTYCAGPVIQLVKSVDFTSIKPFEILTYSIKYTNSGSGPAYNVTIDDVLYTNYCIIIADSAETNNTTTHNPTNYYFDGSTWRPATFDNGNESSVVRVRWQLRNPVNSGESGTLRFKVLIK